MPTRSRPTRPLANGHIADVRRFNRFYTRLVGVLDEGHLHTPFSLTEGRVLFQLANRTAPTAREYGWNERMEALVARVVADYIEKFEPEHERCWIADRRGQNVGCVFVQKDRERDGVAKLRMLLVHPSARGLGIGRRLVDECTRFARDAGYRTISLWTHSVLTTARKVYTDVGYTMIREEVHDSFGEPLTSE